MGGLRFYVDVDSDEGFKIYSDSAIGRVARKAVTVQTVKEIGPAMQELVEHNILAIAENAQKLIDEAEKTKSDAMDLLGKLMR